MKKTKVMRLVSVLCVIVILFTTNISVNAAAIEYALSELQILDHINLDVFDGYENYEITPKGRVGYNVAIEIPNGEVLKLGFEPESILSSAEKTGYDIAAGWKFKFPYLSETTLYETDGKDYKLTRNALLKKINITNYPVSYEFNEIKGEQELLCLEKPYGEKYYFNSKGHIVRYVDSLGKEVKYSYRDNSLCEIDFPDNSAIQIIRAEGFFKILYIQDEISTVLSEILITNNSGIEQISKIIEMNDSINTFEYLTYSNMLLLASYTISGEHERVFTYNHLSDYSRVSNINTTYANGDVTYAIYEYDNKGCISVINKNDAIEKYEYSISLNGNLTVDVEKVHIGETTVRNTIYNRYGQVIQYSYPGTILSLTYNDSNRIIQEIENEYIVNYTYNSFGLPEEIETSKEEKFIYSYSEEGELTSRSFFENGIKKENTNIITDVNSYAENQTNSRSGISVIGYINDEVAITNYHTYYGLNQTGFNCYTFAIGKSSELNHPGYYSNKPIPPNQYSPLFPSYMTIATIKLYTEEDQEALGRSTYDTTVNGTHNSHAWKIAVRVSPGYDYHFMKRSYNSATLPSYWEFKAGQANPVMRLRGNYTPSTASWDTYLFVGNYVYITEDVYTSKLHYICIQD